MKIFLLLLSIGLALGIPLAAAGAEDERPNVVFLIVDDMNMFGFLHEQPGMQTPNLDRLRASGVTFVNAVCNAPSCVPSRASLLERTISVQHGCLSEWQ